MRRYMSLEAMNTSPFCMQGAQIFLAPKVLLLAYPVSQQIRRVSMPRSLLAYLACQMVIPAGVVPLSRLWLYFLSSCSIRAVSLGGVQHGHGFMFLSFSSIFFPVNI